jgi:hypothetical protein
MKSVTYAAAVLAFVVCGASAAAPYATIEEAAVVTDDNVARFESDSIMVQGETRRFDVTVAWRDGFVRPDGAPPRKIVRYLVRCDLKEIALSSVLVFGSTGETAKIFGVPPGAWDFMPVAGGTREAKWFEKTCDAPL